MRESLSIQCSAMWSCGIRPDRARPWPRPARSPPPAGATPTVPSPTGQAADAPAAHPGTQPPTGPPGHQALVVPTGSAVRPPRPDPGHRPPLHRLHRTIPARTRSGRRRVIRRRRQGSATTPRLSAPVHRLVGITPQRPRLDTVGAAVRLSFRAHICGLVPPGSLVGCLRGGAVKTRSRRCELAMTLPRDGGIDLRHSRIRDWRTVLTSSPDARDATCPAGEVVAGRAALAGSLPLEQGAASEPRSCGAGEPALIQVGELAAAGEQLVGWAGLDDPAVLDHGDLVGSITVESRWAITMVVRP